MTPSELADMIQWGRHLSRMTPQEADEIIKCVRFAADMERLYSQGRCPAFYNKGGSDPMVQLSLYDFGERVHFYAEDIYSAARKAVEELQNEGD